MRTNANETKPRLYREQLLTVEDLAQFKTELLEEFKTLLKGNGSNGLNKKWLKSNEVRKLLDISPGTLQNMRVNGTLPFTKIGGVIYYDQDDIQKMFLSKKSHR
ncbi:MAG TPA: helix-turn-helix domain-containing protein [Flavipsychrobacter sp.]|nr:helix-turn-helix domain-containing protein [Flavipsychrobacter sp.]